MTRGLKAKSPKQSGLTRKSVGRKVKSYRRAVVATAGARHNVERKSPRHNRELARELGSRFPQELEFAFGVSEDASVHGKGE